MALADAAITAPEAVRIVNFLVKRIHRKRNVRDGIPINDKSLHLADFGFNELPRLTEVALRRHIFLDLVRDNIFVAHAGLVEEHAVAFLDVEGNDLRGKSVRILAAVARAPIDSDDGSIHLLVDKVDADTDEDAARIAVELILDGRADFLQKGLMQTATILKAVVNKQTGIGIGRPMSHVALLEVPGYAKLLGVTDGGMMPNPDLEGKKAIVRNAVEMFHALGYEEPLLSAICAAENVSPKIIETVDAAALKQAALDGEFGRCILEGPISLDLALDAESAKIKGYESPVTGKTDILVVPSMSAGNIMVKALIEFAGAKMAGVVIGAKCPIALTSRSASFEEKYNSLLVCALMSGGKGAKA